MAKELESISECKNIKEAREFLCNEYNCDRNELAQMFDDHEIMRMINDEASMDSSVKFAISEQPEGLSIESKRQLEYVMECVLSSVNKHPEHSKYYDMISGEIYYVGRKVTHMGKRYSVVLEIENEVIITDSNKILSVSREEANIMAEEINSQEISELFKLSYECSINYKNIGICRFFELFVYIFDLDIKKFIKQIDKSLIEIIEISLRKYSKKDNLSLSFIK